MTRRGPPPNAPTPSNSPQTATNGRGKRTFVDKWPLAIRHATKDELTAVEKSVAIELSWYMNWQSGAGAYAGPARIARCTSLHVVTVKAALRSLVAKGWLTVHERGGLPKPGEQRKANKYAATYPERLGAQDTQSDENEVVDNEPTGSPDFTTGSPDFNDWEPRTPPSLEGTSYELAPEIVESLADALGIPA